MGNTEYRSPEEIEEDKVLDDPKYIEQPSRTAEVDTVILKLPKCLKIKPILKSLCDRGYLEDENGFFEYQDTICLPVDNEKQCKIIVNYLNGVYGNIASYGYKAVPHTFSLCQDFETRGHIATVRGAKGQLPNEQFSAFELKAEDKSGFPVYETVDVERKLRFMRPHMGKVMQNVHKKNLEKQSSQKTRTRKNQFGVANVTFENKDEVQAAKSHDTRAEAMAMFAGGFSGGNAKQVSPRKAVTLDYTHKARHLREASQKCGAIKKTNAQIGQSIMSQFVRDHSRNLIRTKKKKYQLNRTKRIYDQQSNSRLEQTYLKQRYDPVAQKRRNLAAQTLWDQGGSAF